MKTVLALAALGTVAASVPQQTPGAITISYEAWKHETRVRIVPEGTLTIETIKPDADEPSGKLVERQNFETRLLGYPRIKALVAPMRRWAGRTAPCEGSASNMVDLPNLRGPREPPVVIRWEADGVEARFDLGCLSGPAIDEIELARAALEYAKGWQADTYDLDNKTVVEEVPIEETTNDPPHP